MAQLSVPGTVKSPLSDYELIGNLPAYLKSVSIEKGMFAYTMVIPEQTERETILIRLYKLI